MRRTLPRAAIAAVAGLAAAVPAQAAHPRKGRYYNGSYSHGAYLVTTRHAVRTLWFFCSHPAYAHNGARYSARQSRYEVPRPLHVRSNGTFSYRGRADRWGAETQWLGSFRVRVSGRFVSSTRVKLTRRATNCAGTTASARLQR